MAEGQPHLSIQMSDTKAEGTPGRKQSSPDAAGRGGSTLTFHNICYHVKMKTGFLGARKTYDKEVLRDVRYVFKHLFRERASFNSAWTVESAHANELLPMSGQYTEFNIHNIQNLIKI